MSRSFHYGGQAVIEGVMIRGRAQAALAVRRPDRIIETRGLPVPGWATGRSRAVPLIRGVVVFAETLIVGMKALTLSASISTNEGGQGRPDDQAITPLAMALTLALAIGFAIALFFLAPLFISKALEAQGMSELSANVVEGLLRLAAFIGYLALIARIKDVQRVLEYHGAEHMTIAAHEAGATLDVASVRRFPRAHPRCGTAFLMTVILVSIVVFMFVPRDPLPLVVASRILLVPVIAAVSYEIIRYASRHPESIWVRLITAPNLMLQALTTREPDDDQIEVAISAMGAALAFDGDSLGKPSPGAAGAGPASGPGPSSGA
jgi:uncharacterized protein YqhQ